MEGHDRNIFAFGNLDYTRLQERVQIVLTLLGFQLYLQEIEAVSQ